MANAERGIQNTEQGRARGESPYVMRAGVVYHIDTGKRLIRGTLDFSMFDENPGIAARRAKGLPKGTEGV
jgi:hypothetical protein